MTALNQKEKEALAWTMCEIMDRARVNPADRSDPIAILRAAGHKPAKYSQAAGRLLDQHVYKDRLEGPFSDLEALILKTCVENTRWIAVYRKNSPTADSPSHINEALATLRSLAAKLEALGIEIVHIPFE